MLLNIVLHPGKVAPEGQENELSEQLHCGECSKYWINFTDSKPKHHKQIKLLKHESNKNYSAINDGYTDNLRIEWSDRDKERTIGSED